MKIIFYYSLLFLILLVLQFSFFNILFSFVGVPLVILIAGIIWTLRLGFREALWLLVPLLLLYDVLGSGRLEIFSVYVIFFVYTVSFLSRRVLLENVTVSTLIYSLFTYLGILLYALSRGLFGEHNWMYFSEVTTQALGILILIVGTFLVVRSIILRFQNKIDQLRSDSALMIR